MGSKVNQHCDEVPIAERYLKMIPGTRSVEVNGVKPADVSERACHEAQGQGFKVLYDEMCQWSRLAQAGGRIKHVKSLIRRSNRINLMFEPE